MPRFQTRSPSTRAEQRSGVLTSSRVREGLRTSGRPLDASTRAFMEPRFGHDFSRVRIHTDPQAARSAAEMEARAYTIGHDIVFGSGEYAEGTSGARRLLAHELAHVVQQRSCAAPAAQPKLRVSEGGDAGEVAADRAADAVLSGARAPELAPVANGFVQRQQAQRTCRRTGANGDLTTVTCSDGTEYDVATTVVNGFVPSTQANVTGGLAQQSTLYLQLEVCRGGNSVTITPSMNIAQPLQQIIQNALAGTSPVSGVRIEPTATFGWTLSQQFELHASGGPVIVQGAPRTGWQVGVGGQVGRRATVEANVGSDPTLTGPGGGAEIHGGVTVSVPTDPVARVDCVRPQKTVTYQCTPVRYTPPVTGRDADDVEAYVFFDYATANVIPPTPVVQRGSAALNSSDLAALADGGYRVVSIDAHTSPEGPRGAPRRPGGFVGNDVLSEQRRDAALTWLRANCPGCLAGDPATSAQSELYSGWRRPGVELEGDPLTTRAREGFLGHEDEPRDPLARPEHERLGTLPPAQQRAELYPLLRRAVIHLHRAAIQAQQRQRQPPGAAGECLPEVQEAMRRP